MNPVRLLIVAIAVVAVAAVAPCAFAQERVPEARPSADEVRALRLLVEKQARELDELRMAFEELSKVVQLKEGAKLPGSLPAGGPPTPTPAPAAAQEPAATPPAAPPPEPRVERAEPVPPGVAHTVAKGETLTSIAKHYNVSIAELHKANKITDDRKLQIGQVLQIPTKPAEPSDKKETP